MNLFRHKTIVRVSHNSTKKTKTIQKEFIKIPNKKNIYALNISPTETIIVEIEL